MNINYYKNFEGTENSVIDLNIIIKNIKNGRWQTQITEIRNCINGGENEKASVLKKTSLLLHHQELLMKEEERKI